LTVGENSLFLFTTDAIHIEAAIPSGSSA